MEWKPLSKDLENQIVTYQTIFNFDDQKIKEKEKHRFLLPQGFKSLVRNSNLTFIKYFGDFKGNELDSEEAWRMIPVLRKEE